MATLYAATLGCPLGSQALALCPKTTSALRLRRCGSSNQGRQPGGAVQQRPPPQPGEQRVAIRRREHRIQRVAPLALGHAGRPRQQVEGVERLGNDELCLAKFSFLLPPWRPWM